MIKVNANLFVLENATVKRELRFTDDGLKTTALVNKMTGDDRFQVA